MNQVFGPYRVRTYRSLFTSCPILVHKVYLNSRDDDKVMHIQLTQEAYDSFKFHNPNPHQGIISANRCKKMAYEMRSPTSIQSVFKGA